MRQPRRCSGLIIGLFSLGLLAGAALTASPAQAASGPGPYYAEPAWDRKLACAIGNCPRFVVLTNWASAAVLDKETGLVWERTPSNTLHVWAAARLQCTASETGNRKGWRLPSIPELMSLVDPLALSTPTLPPGHPFTTGASGVQAAHYWSATTKAELPVIAWGVNFSFGGLNDAGKTASLLVWCVRGGNNADAY